MSIASVVLQGTVKPDGTLELDQKVTLPAGRVQVTVELAAKVVQGGQDWWQYLQAARAQLEARGTGFRSAEEIEAEGREFRSGDNRVEEIYREIEEEKKRLEQKEC